ncbi:hypothetical protein CRE_05258 [Caenorhabditis remanei]|uniref:F-box domain-containing protein n=1 Tax=Caenorhabditis remanei TaxID=31234 RepID=E3NIE5_CAERE|nr:hypothetical protein CRE_05258 [Caenorhabditis remanei]
MSSPFPLLRLPRLVLCEVFKSLSIGEKIKLSLCSKKVSAQFNNARFYSQRVMVYLDMLNQNIKVRSETDKDKFEISIHPHFGMSNDPDMQQYRIEGRTVPGTSCRIRITTFWEKPREGSLSVLRHILKIFECKISTNRDYDSDLYQSTISLLFDLQMEFKTLTIHLKGSKGDNLLWNQISNKLGLVEDLTISSSLDPGFRPVFTSWPQKINIMCIMCNWFTLETLLDCTCTTIILDKSHLGNKDLDVILKNWMTGGLPNLEYLKIQSQNISKNGTTILGMNLRELAGMVIRTDDGSKKATIKTNVQSIEMSVTPFE